MNLRILIYLNPSNINKITHKFALEADSGFLLVKNSILALNKIVEWHFYLLVPSKDCWIDAPNNVTLIEYPYINDALNSRFHFDSISINNYFSTYKHDIDLIWTMLPEHASALKGITNKRREQVPCFSYINWMDYTNNGYAPSFKLRMLDGIYNSDSIGIQSEHMNKTLLSILSGFDVPIEKIKIIPPKTNGSSVVFPIGDIIGFPHRVSQESGYTKMIKLIGDDLKYKLWVSNINNSSNVVSNPKINNIFFENRADFFNQIKALRFGLSFHVGYSMWSMSVLDMMAYGKVVLAPNQNAFPEMFPKDYPFLFSNDKEFITKFKYLQECPDEELLYWGQKNQEQVNIKYTWDIQALNLKDLFYDLVVKTGTKKTAEVYKIIEAYNAITKGDIINKNISSFGRRCSRAWNKCRIELMNTYDIKDDITKEHTLFFKDRERYTNNGIEFVPHKIPTAYDIKHKQ